jgi:hypothetical protein
MAFAMLYFGIHLTFWAIDQHQRAVERHERPPIELRRGTK